MKVIKILSVCVLMIVTITFVAGCTVENTDAGSSQTLVEGSTAQNADVGSSQTLVEGNTAQNIDADNGHKLTFKGDSSILLDNPDGYYAGGETVTVKTHIIFDAYIVLYLNGEKLDCNETAVQNSEGQYTHWEFYFTMPDKDAELTYEIKDAFIESTQAP